jgi:predicted MFS family arabinose efflux permease
MTKMNDAAIANLPTKSLQASTVALAGTLLLAAAMGIGRFAYTPLLPAMQETFGWTVPQAGDVASANYLGYMLGALVASLLAQRPERRHWLLTGMVLCAISIAAGAVVTSLWAWLAIRFFAGVASALCLILGTAIIVEFLTSQARPQLGALHFGGIGVGIMVSVLIIELVQRAGFSVFGRWGALGLTSVLLLSASWRILRQLPDQQSRGKEGQVSMPQGRATPTTSIFNRQFTRLIIAYGLFGFGYVVTATFIVLMARRLDYATVVEPLTWLVVGLFAASSIFVWQRVTQHIGLFAALRLAYFCEAIGVLLAGFGGNHAALLVGGALLGGTFVGITAMGLNAARQSASNNPGKAMGWLTASFGLGQLLGPAVAGRLAQMSGGFETPSLVAAVLLMVGIALLWGIEKF